MLGVLAKHRLVHSACVVRSCASGVPRISRSPWLTLFSGNLELLRAYATQTAVTARRIVKGFDIV
jgi:hypothetical protein